ncbi:related to Vacuolar protein sorting-associated protein 55 [Saccharomycodes ludwigii]|uniref:Related to Vacuolar protein sorting-associated protein 55 n=1 Tax=Saccharomycodes ludwigii TaxID=36035 RepID=A0A376BBI1_9ASCO|nr:related to Vacuolar protein sorting-associated protein 55 [Saccharomycodes ludwigii]
MSISISPLTKIISLSAILALGFLLVILSCALYSNYYPLFDISLFLIAPLPKLILNNAIGAHNNNSDFLSGTNGGEGDDSFYYNTKYFNGVRDTGDFLTSWFLILGIGLPVVFHHCNIINKWSMFMCISGGLIIYTSIVTFSIFFNGKRSGDGWDDDDEGGYGYGY